ncbi:ankyrin repeat-containing domain protein [Tuber borchii]|uniref:Ankyrin repeat-containing domain protein n=1 Tax=Tuber borchii TaxID=42251 RepID=A0A2T7A0S9_TUBBO|nr:ankyrin repeat-containing domain protein [Tuber borchii]
MNADTRGQPLREIFICIYLHSRAISPAEGCTVGNILPRGIPLRRNQDSMLPPPFPLTSRSLAKSWLTSPVCLSCSVSATSSPDTQDAYNTHSTNTSGDADTIMKLLELPNEVLLLVAGFVPPPSLLSLIRANRFTHALLSPLLINNFRNNRALCEEYGLKALYFVAERGNKATVKRLLERGLLKYVGDGTLLNSAVVTQPDAVLRTLLDCGVAVNTRDSDKRTPLSIVTRMGRLGALKMLLERPDTDVNVEDQKRESPIRHLVRKGDEATLRALLQHKRVDVNRLSKSGWAPIHDAINKKIHVVLHMLIQDPRMNVNSAGLGGWTALHLAIRMHNEEAFHLILGHPDIDVNAQDTDGCTPLHVAVHWGSERIVRVLARRGDVRFGITNALGRTPFQAVVNSGQEKLVALFPPAARI